VGVGFSLASTPLLLARPALFAAMSKATERLLSDKDLRDALDDEGLRPYPASVVSFGPEPIEVSPEQIDRASERLQQLESRVRAFLKFFDDEFKDDEPPENQREAKKQYDSYLKNIKGFLQDLWHKPKANPAWFVLTLLPELESLEKDIK
jgi:hypothetical protein